MTPYNYTQCGLPNVWLIKGVEIHDTSYGKGVSIQNVEGLHKAIALALTEKPDPLTGAEFRFLRKELELSQKSLGKLLAIDAQTIAKWEKSEIVDNAANFLIRHIYKQTINKHESYVELVNHLNDLDHNDYFKLEFKLEDEKDSDWERAA